RGVRIFVPCPGSQQFPPFFGGRGSQIGLPGRNTSRSQCIPTHNPDTVNVYVYAYSSDTIVSNSFISVIFNSVAIFSNAVLGKRTVLLFTNSEIVRTLTPVLSDSCFCSIPYSFSRSFSCTLIITAIYNNAFPGYIHTLLMYIRKHSTTNYGKCNILLDNYG